MLPSAAAFFQSDRNGSPLSSTWAGGGLLWIETYRPFGEQINATGNGINQTWFGGQKQSAGGLIHMGARVYDPVAGRFLSTDPQEVNPSDLHSFNRYAYANNNPYRFVDPDGNTPLDAAFLIYDLAKLGVALYSGAGVGAAAADVALSLVGLASPVPGTGQALKAARIADKAVDAKRAAGSVDAGGAKWIGPDFVVTSSGTAVPVSQSRMREGFDAAGFPSRAADKTAEVGVIHTVPTRSGSIDVRTMEGSGHHPRRAVFTRGGTNDPVRMDGRQFPNGTPRVDRRAGSHLDQAP